MQAKRVYYGWVMMTALSVSAMVSWGITYYTFSVVLTPMQRELGWTPAQLTGAFSLALFATGFADVFVGRWLDAHGPRVLMTAGALLAAGLVWAWAQVQTLPAFYLVMLGMGLASAMVQYAPSFWVAAHWFRRKRGVALTILTIGGGLASTVFVPLTNALVLAQGWRVALMTLAVILSAVTLPIHALLLRHLPASVGGFVDGMPHDDGATTTPSAENKHTADKTKTNICDTLRHPAFWILASVFSLNGFAFNGISVHLISYALARGEDATFVAAAAGLAGLCQVVGRVCIVPLSDRVARRTLFLSLFVVQLMAFVALFVQPLRVGIVAHVILRGLSVGPLSPLRASLLADVFGTKHYGSIAGTMSFVVSLAVASAPLAVGVLVGWGGYTPVLFIFVMCCALAMGLFTRLKLSSSSVTTA